MITTFKEYKKVRHIRSKSALIHARKRFKAYKAYKKLTGFRIIKNRWILTQF